MAHDIEGNYAFFASDKPAWHGLGHVLKDAPTITDAWKMAYPHHLIEANLTGHVGEANAPVESHKAIFRDDGKLIGVVGKDYGVVQPFKLFSAFDPLLSSGLVELEAGGSLRDGKRAWALGKLKNTETDIVPGDSVKGYILFYTGFDGSLSLGATQTTVRVVCANTLALARNKGVDFKMRHTNRVNGRFDNAVTSIKQSIENHNKSIEAYKMLAAKQVTTKAVSNYVTELFATKEAIEAKDISSKMETKINRVFEVILEQREKELIPAIRGTAWEAYNGVTRYLTHEAGRSQDTRLDSQWFGEGANQNAKALEMATAM